MSTSILLFVWRTTTGGRCTKTNSSSKQHEQQQQAAVYVATRTRAAAALCIHAYMIRITISSKVRFLGGWPGERVGHDKVTCGLGVGVSSRVLGPVLVVWARGQCGGSVMMRAVFGAQLPRSHLPAAVCMDTISHVGSRPSDGGSLGYLTCVIFCRMFAERSQK